jgi:hypothetical protein
MNYYIKPIMMFTMSRIYLNDDNLGKITPCINYVNSPNINPLWSFYSSAE